MKVQLKNGCIFGQHSWKHWAIPLILLLVVRMSVTLVHPDKAVGRKEMPFGRDTLVSQTGAPVPMGKEDLGLEPPVKNCSANCSQTCTDSGTVTIGNLQKISNALPYRTITDLIRLPLPQFGGRNPQSVCIAICDQTVTDIAEWLL